MHFNNQNLYLKNLNRLQLHHVLIASALSFASASHAFAQNNRQIPGYQGDANSRSDNRGGKSWSVVVGGGVAVGPLSEGGGDTEVLAIPVLNITYRDFFYIDIAEGVGFNLLSNDTTLLSIDANFASSRSEDDGEDGLFNDGDFERFAGLGNVDGDVALEVYASQIVFDRMELSVSATREFGNVRGWQVTGGAATGYEIIDSLFLGAQISATWSSQNYAQAFFGVTEAQAQNRRSIAATNTAVTPYNAFDAGAGFTDVSVGAGLFKTFGKNDQFFAALDGGYSFALGDLRDSPITERTAIPSGSFTLGWRF